MLKYKILLCCMQPVKYSLFYSKQIRACKNNLLVLYIRLFKIDEEISCLDVEDKFAEVIVIPKLRQILKPGTREHQNNHTPKYTRTPRNTGESP